MAKKVEIDLSNLKSWINPCYYPLLWDENRFLILFGGAGSGKSVFSAQKTVFRIIQPPKQKILVIRKVQKTLRESCFAEIKTVINDWGLKDLFVIPKGKNDFDIVYKPNGNMIIFAGLDDREKLKSIQGVTSIWIEEASELDEEDFRQINLRLRGNTESYKQIILTFNPVSILHWLKKEFFDLPKSNATIMKTTYKDNKFIDTEYSMELEKMKDIDEYFYMVYALGMWGVTGKSIFPAQLVSNRLEQVKNQSPKRRGFFKYEYDAGRIIDNTIEWIEDPDGPIMIFEDPKPGTPYVIGADPAGEGSDWFAAFGINNVTGKQVCLYHQQKDEDLFTYQLYCLGRWFNDALLGPETNFSTFPVRELDRLGYYNIYKREVFDRITNSKQNAYGWQTTKRTRNAAIANLVGIVRDHIDYFNDQFTLQEMLTFIRNVQGRPEAAEGQHDDCIMAAAICYSIREQERDWEEEFVGGTVIPGKFESTQKGAWEKFKTSSSEEYDDDDDETGYALLRGFYSR